MRRPGGLWLGVCCAAACAGGSNDDTGSFSTPSTDPSTLDPGTSSGSTGPVVPTTGGPTTGPEPTTSTSAPTMVTDPTGCGRCDTPLEQCVDGECVAGCQGQGDAGCGDQRCDVVTGQCVPDGTACAVTGPAVDCGGVTCAGGSVCDGQGQCLPVAPCIDVVCSTSACWGAACECERAAGCSDPAGAAMNGPFSADISGLDFSDDCDAWAVTVSGGQEFVRRLTPAGELTTYGANGDFDLGEVRVLRHLVPPALTAPKPYADAPAPPPEPVEGFGEVALTYICCPTCGDCANNPDARGVAHLVEDDPNMPLPIVIFAEPTQGTGPFGEVHLDGGPQGLTWGEDRVLYVGNTTANGDYNSADLESGTVAVLYNFPERVTASAPVSPVHVLVALESGELHLFNTATKQASFLVDVMSGVTSLSQDPFDGTVYAGLATLEVVAVRPFTGEVDGFAMMPVKGRVAVSPSGQLWFTPVKYLTAGTLSAWPLPTTL
jgi:hypothetical protein